METTVLAGNRNDTEGRAAIYTQMIAAKYPGRALLRIPEAGEVIGYKKSKAHMLAADGTLPTVRVASRRMVPVDRLIAWLIEQGGDDV